MQKKKNKLGVKIKSKYSSMNDKNHKRKKQYAMNKELGNEYMDK